MLTPRGIFYLLSLNFVLVVAVMMSKVNFLFPIIFPLNFFICIYYVGGLIVKRFNRNLKFIGLFAAIILSGIFIFLSNASMVSTILTLGILFYLNLQAISVAFVIKYRYEEENENDEAKQESENTEQNNSDRH